MPKPKKKPAEGSPPKWFIRFPKPKRKAREWDVWVWENWCYKQEDIGTHAPSLGLQHTKIRVREILPRTPAKKRGKR
jgi:hypothetical protein